MRNKLFLLSVIFLALFTQLSYVVAKEAWQKVDFDTTVKLQDHISRKYDLYFSYFSLVGSTEITIGFCLIMAGLFLIKRRWLAVVGWIIIIPASLVEVFGKLVLFHPGPPVFFHRSLLPTSLPSFYIHTNFSYPSGHMTRAIFIITILVLMTLFSKLNLSLKLVMLLSLVFFGFMMGLTRVYLGEHWSSDVVGGALLGISCGLFAYLLIFKARLV